MATSNGIRVGVRCAYGSNFWERLLPFIKLGQIELAFWRVENFLGINPAKAVEPIKEWGFEVPSLHMAQAKVADIGKGNGKFLPVFFKTLPLMLKLKTRLLVVHPTNGTVSKIGPLVDDCLAKALEDQEITLCWETFSGRGRFIGPVETIAEFVKDRPFQAICYDTAHVGESQEKVLADIKEYGELVKVWHLSNRKKEIRRGGKDQHLPLSHPEGILDFGPILKAIQQYSPDSVITLEYLKPFHHLLLRDALRVRRKLSPE